MAAATGLDEYEKAKDKAKAHDTRKRQWEGTWYDLTMPILGPASALSLISYGLGVMFALPVIVTSGSIIAFVPAIFAWSIYSIIQDGFESAIAS